MLLPASDVEFQCPKPAAAFPVSDHSAGSHQRSLSLSQMRKEIADITNYLHRQGFLDGEFTRLLELQDRSCPDFVIKVAKVFFKDCQQIINDLDIALQLQVVDFNKVLARVHQLKGSSSSFGAARMREICVKLRPLCESQNRNGCIKILP